MLSPLPVVTVATRVELPQQNHLRNGMLKGFPAAQTVQSGHRSSSETTLYGNQAGGSRLRGTVQVSAESCWWGKLTPYNGQACYLNNKQLVWKIRMAYKDSDYTVVIATMQKPNRTILVLKFSMVVEIQALLLCCRPPLLDRSLRNSLPAQLLRRPHKDSDHTDMIAVVVSAVISSCLPFGCHCWLDRLSIDPTWHVC